jgi:hypothetical protein
MDIDSIASIAYAATGIISLLYISRQVAITRHQAKGQFLLALDEQLEKSSDTTLRLFNEQNFEPTGKEWGEIWLLMNIYERINIIVEDRILDIDMVERIYGFRVIAIILNDAIYQRIQEMGAEWHDFIDLCNKLARHYSQGKHKYGNELFCERVKKLDKHSERLANPWKFQEMQ